MWLRKLPEELGFVIDSTINMCRDLLQVIRNSYDATHHGCTKHIHVEYHWIHEWITSNKATITYVKLEDNIMDILPRL